MNGKSPLADAKKFTSMATDTGSYGHKEGPVFLKKKDLNKWRQGFGSKRTEKDPNAMDTTPGRARVRRMTTTNVHA